MAVASTFFIYIKLFSFKLRNVNKYLYRCWFIKSLIALIICVCSMLKLDGFNYNEDLILTSALNGYVLLLRLAILKICNCTVFYVSHF